MQLSTLLKQIAHCNDDNFDANSRANYRENP